MKTKTSRPKESKVPQMRWVCPFCRMEGWWTPSTHIGINPLHDHDRKDGRRCRGWQKLGQFLRNNAKSRLPFGGES